MCSVLTLNTTLAKTWLCGFHLASLYLFPCSNRVHTPKQSPSVFLEVPVAEGNCPEWDFILKIFNSFSKGKRPPFPQPTKEMKDIATAQFFTYV